jgi:hypothetical protein
MEPTGRRESAARWRNPGKLVRPAPDFASAPSGLRGHGFKFQTAPCVDTVSRSRGSSRPRFAGISLDPPIRGCGECRAPMRRGKKCMRSNHGHTGNTRHPRAMVYGLLRALPGDRALLPPSLAGMTASLTPASRCQDHTTWPSASCIVVSALPASTASRPDVRDVRETPLWWGGMRWR